jgi:hypothetical protein
MNQRPKERDGRDARRRCVICKADTWWNECKNAGCMSHSTTFSGVEYPGVPLCSPTVKARKNLKEYGFPFKQQDMS